MKPKASYLYTVAAIGLTAVLAAPMALSAADSIQDRGRPGSQSPSLAMTLNLSQEQDAKLRAILDADAAQWARARHATHERILSLLSEAQRGQYEALIQQRSARQLQELADAMKLTPDQTTRLGAILMLADARYASSIVGSDLAEAIRTGLNVNDEQARKLAALSSGYRTIDDTAW